jgi:transposase-like protein
MVATKKKRGVSKRRAFLAAFAATASVTRAARAARIDRSLPYRWLKEDSEYARDFAQAFAQAGETLEAEAIRRAHEGVDEPLTYQGRFTYKQRLVKGTATTLAVDGSIVEPGTADHYEDYGRPLAVRKYSDGLLQFLLKGFMKERYSDRSSVEVSGVGGAAILLSNEKLAALSDEELATLAALARKLDVQG